MSPPKERATHSEGRARASDLATAHLGSNSEHSNLGSISARSRLDLAHDVDDGGGPLLGVAVADQVGDLRGELGEEDLDLLCEELVVELLA